MAAIGESVATQVAQSLADKATQELKYLCCYKSYVDDFEEEKTSLSARRSRVLKDIKEAKDRNENQIENEVELWLDRANGLVEEDTKGKKKWFGLVTNCFWQYQRGKELEGKTQSIRQLMEQSNSLTRVARSTGLPGIEFYSSPNFMQFEYRKLQFEKLTEALKDDKKFMIGLYGLGGTGKTTMALEVGKEVEESKVFDKVIFSVVSKFANLKKIRDNIATQLNFSFKQGMDESEQAQLWKRIVEGEEKLLIILDDIWENLTLRDIGIPLGRHGKGCCAILLTTRDWRVCRDMGCHETIELEVLNVNDAVDLFLSYAGKSIDGSSNDIKDVALGIVKECGRLPVAIVAVARALKSRPLKEWEQALERLRNPESVHDVKEDLKEAYNSLRLSYDHLNEKAKQLFLLCSLFPEDYEMPIEFLTRMAIGLGLCGEANKYSTARSHFTPIKNELIDSCLLLKVGNESVKMHDLVREVALWIGNRQVQVVMDSNTTLMENAQYSSWNTLDFPNHFDCRKLEVLLVWLNNITHSLTDKVPDDIVEGMENLRILALMIQSEYKISAASLFKSPLSWINDRTLAIRKMEIGDLSMLVNLKSLESLELIECSIVEFPNKIRELEKLRLLEMVDCLIEANNPLEVIGSCSQLEELYYVANRLVRSLAQTTTLPKLQRYYIKCEDGITISNICGVNFPKSRYYASRVKLSNEVFKSLVARAEVLKLGRDYYNRGWTNIVPDMLPVKDDNVEDHLTMLSLESVHEIKCLIRTEHLRSSVPIFSKLVELQLLDMHVGELCCGPYPVDFLKQLKMLKLSRCQKLESVLFDGTLELCNLQSICLQHCSIACLFHPSTAHSLKQLETLEINGCYKLKYIVAETTEDHYSNQRRHNDSIFPKLNYLKLVSCPELEFILPISFCQDLPLLKSMLIFSCGNLKYIFGQYAEERDLHQMGKQAILQLLEEVVLSRVPNFISIYTECYLPMPSSSEVQKSSPSTKVEDGSSNLSRGLLCCFLPKSNASTIHHPSASMNTQLDHNQELMEKYVVNGAHGFFIPPLYPCKSLRRIGIVAFRGLKSLFTLAVASSLDLLETLEVKECDALDHIITDEGSNSHGHMNIHSIFPNLQQVSVWRCNNLEYVFPAFYSKDFKHLESMNILKAGKMKYVFGKCHADQDHNVQSKLNLPSFKGLDLDDVPNMVSFCAENYYVELSGLEYLRFVGCLQLPQTSIDFFVGGHKRQEDLSRGNALSSKDKGRPLSNFQDLPDSRDIYVGPKSFLSFRNLSKVSFVRCKELKFILSASTKRSMPELRKLTIDECQELVSIIEDDEENQQNPLDSHQPCFQKLRIIQVGHCKKLKCVFSISTCVKLPRLLLLDVQDAPELVQVFEWKQGAPQDLVIKDVLPSLVGIRLVNLPSLHTIYQGMDFQTVKIRLVRHCNNISLDNVNAREIFNFHDSLQKKQMNFLDHDNEKDARDIIFHWALERKREELFPEARERDQTKSEQNTSAPDIAHNTETSTSEIVEQQPSTSNAVETPSSKSQRESCIKESKGDQEALGERISLTDDPERLEEPTNDLFPKETTNKVALAIPPTNTTSTTEMTSPLRQEVSKKIAEKDSTTHKQNNNSPNLTERTTASANEIVKEELSTAPLSNSDMELCGNQSMGDQQELGETRSFNEAPQRVEEPTNECSSKETSNPVALTIPPSITEITSPPISSISSPKKLQIATSTAHVDMESGSSAITDQSTQREEVSKKIAKKDSKTHKLNNNSPNLTEELCGNESMGDQQELGETTSSNEAPQRVEEPTNAKETSNQVALTTPPSITKITSPPISSISSPKKPQIATSTAHMEMEPGSSAITDQSAQGQTLVNQRETSIDVKHKVDHVKPKQIEEDDLIRLFRIMRDGSDLEVGLPYISKVAAFEDDKVSKAFADIHRLENALNLLSTHFSEGKPSSHGLIRGKIDSLHQEIQRILSSFKQASDTIDTFAKLKDREKWMDEQHSQKMEAAITLVSEIRNTEDYMIDLKEQISRLQDELKSKEKEFEYCETKLSSLQKKKKECVLDTIGFMEEYEAVKKDRLSYVADGQTEARQELRKVENQWPSCMADLRKTALLLGILLKQKP